MEKKLSISRIAVLSGVLLAVGFSSSAAASTSPLGNVVSNTSNVVPGGPGSTVLTPPASSPTMSNSIGTNVVLSPVPFCKVSSDLPHPSSTITGEVSGHSVTDCNYTEPYLEVGAQIWYDWGVEFGNQIGGNTKSKALTNYLKVGAGGDEVQEKLGHARKD